MILPVDISKYTAFLAAMFIMAIMPGPAILFCIRTGFSGSKARVLACVGGLNSATLIWFAAAALGLQIILTTVPLLFEAIAIAGGFYLIWLGYKGVRAALDINNEKLNIQPADVAPKSVWATYKEGFTVQVLNPKVTLFFSAVLPPFVDTHRPMPAQMVMFAATTLTMDAIAMTSYGLGAVSLAHLLSDPKNKQRFDLTVSGILTFLGVLICVHTGFDLIKSY